MNKKHRTNSKVTTDRVKQPRHSIRQQWHKESFAPMKRYVKTKYRAAYYVYCFFSVLLSVRLRISQPALYRSA